MTMCKAVVSTSHALATMQASKQGRKKRALSQVWVVPKRRGKTTAYSIPLWLVSYADMATLLLCFMVLLTALSVLNIKKTQRAVGSIQKNYVAPMLSQPDTQFDQGMLLNPNYAKLGVHTASLADIFQGAGAFGDIKLESNRFVDAVSMGDESLFKPDTIELTDDGKKMLDRLLPLLVEAEHPLLIVGHSSLPRDEKAAAASMRTIVPDAESHTWLLSLGRARAVAAYLISMGVQEKLLTVEAGGQFHSRYSLATPSERIKNRRVDVIFDKRNTKERAVLSRARPNNDEEAPSDAYFKGFHFDLTMPSTTSPANLGDEVRPFTDDQQGDTNAQ